MAGSLNKACLLGNLGKDPEVRATHDGREIASFSLATSESWKDKNSGERKETTEWHKVVVFNEGLVKVIKNHLHKGSTVYIEGQMKTRKWTDKDGVERYTTEVVLGAFGGMLQMVGAKQDGSRPPPNDGSGQSYQQPQRSSAPPTGADLDDEIPF